MDKLPPWDGTFCLIVGYIDVITVSYVKMNQMKDNDIKPDKFIINE